MPHTSLRLAVRVAVVAGAALAVGGCDVCDGADGLEGTFTLRDQNDLDDFPDGKCIRGDLSIGSPDGQFALNSSITDLSALASIEIVEGTISVEGNSALQTLSLPALTYAGRRLLEPNSNANKVRGGFFIIANQSLTTIDMPELHDVGGCFGIQQNGALAPSAADDVFRQTTSHAFPGSCDGPIENNDQNGSGFVPAG